MVGGAIKGTAKATLAVSTMGLSLIPSLVKKDKNDTDWYSFEDLVSYELIVNNQTVVSGGVGQALVARRYVWTYWSGCRWYRIQTKINL